MTQPAAKTSSMPPAASADAGFQSILVVDDHPLYCEALKSSLQRIFEAERIESVSCLADALNTALQPDLILLDLKLPDVEGLNGFARLRELRPDVPIIVISAEISEAQLSEIMALGGSGYVGKNESQASFEEAMRSVEQGKKCFPDWVSDRVESLAPQSNTQDVMRRVADLTPQQSRILNLISDGKPNKQIAFELDLAEATVKAHVTALLRRLGVRNRTQAALLVRGLHMPVSAPTVAGLH